MFEGALTALITPFRDDAVDEAALRDLVERQIDGGIDGLVPCGTTGESVNLSDAEFDQVLRITLSQARGRVPVIAGSGSASTRDTVLWSELARKAGADGLLVVVPPYNRPTQAGIEAHYRAVATACSLPIVLYNIPARTGVDLSLDTMDALSDVKSIVAIKEATGNVTRSAAILARFGDRFTVLSGDDALTLPIIASGGQGVISVASNVAPALMATLVDTARAGDLVAARKTAQRLAPLFDALFLESSPGPVKAALASLGRIAPEIRLPMVMPGAATRAQVQRVLEQLELT